ncbi:MAG: TAXI family TRAP transporter solute-binding subunit [Rhodospirillales bacterium]|nr:TAXI family TRAP transporter solute-binding subunit [Rhodospirillales bacterium]
MKILTTLAAMIVSLLGASANAASWGVGSGPQGTVIYTSAAAIAKLASEKAGLDLRVQPYGGSSQYVPLVGTKEIDFALANILEVSSAVDGTLIFQGRKSPDIRVVAVIFPLTGSFFVRADSPIKSLKDLKGKRLPTGYSSQAIIRPLTDAVLANGMISTDDVKAGPVPNVIRAAEDFAQGKADAFFFGIGGAKVAEVAAGVGGVRLLPLDDDPRAVAAMRKIVPQSYITTLQPSDKYVGVVGPTKVMAYDFLLIAGAHVPDEIVHKLTATIAANKADLAAAAPFFFDFEVAKMAKKNGLSYHPGAVKFYQESGLWPPKD